LQIEKLIIVRIRASINHYNTDEMVANGLPNDEDRPHLSPNHIYELNIDTIGVYVCI